MPMHHLDDPMTYRNFIQMPPELCQKLEQRITAEFQRDRTLMRDPVSLGVKLVVTLRHLATGDSYTTLQYAFRLASQTLEKFVPEVCDAITRAYRDQVMQCPTFLEDWLLVESVFCWGWNFPHALGALDGSIFQSDVHKGEAASSATARASTPLYSWPWWMEIPSSCGWTWRQPGQLQILRFSTTPI